jgi:hypothetical protein
MVHSTGRRAPPEATPDARGSPTVPWKIYRRRRATPEHRRPPHATPAPRLEGMHEPLEPFGIVPPEPTLPEELDLIEPTPETPQTPRVPPVRNGAISAVLGAAMFALRDILEPSRREEPGIVVEAAEPAGDVEADGVNGAVTAGGTPNVQFHPPALPRCSVWTARPRGRAPRRR